MNISSVYDVSAEPANPMSLLDILEQVENEYFQPTRSDPFNAAINRIAEVGKRVDKTRNVIQADETKAKNHLKFIQMSVASKKEKLHSLHAEIAAAKKRIKVAEDQERRTMETLKSTLGDRTNTQLARNFERKALIQQSCKRIAIRVENDQLENTLRNANVVLLRNEEDDIQAFNPTSREVLDIGAPRSIGEICHALNELTTSNTGPINKSRTASESDENDSMT